MEILPFLLWPFMASLILTGIHAYLGVHVVERGVIFVDLALAQIAALGATVAILAGMDPHGLGAYWLSLAFTFVGAAVFAFARTRRGHIPQEAFIGIAYAVASAAAILAMSKATGETEHLKDMLVGNILAVSRHDVMKTALLYGVMGVFHYIFRRRFLLISTDPEQAEAQGHQHPLLGFSFLRIVRFCRDLVGRDCRRAAGLLLSDRSVGGSYVVRRPRWPATGDRLDHGHAGFRAGRVLFRAARSSDRRDHRLHLRRGAHRHVPDPPLVLPWSGGARFGWSGLSPRTQRSEFCRRNDRIGRANS